MYQDAVMVPTGDWAKSRLKKLSETDTRRDTSKVGSGFGKNISNWLGREMAYPTNVLHLTTECSNKKHSAAFPKELPSWFIKLFTKEGDLVLDPFLGSGTTNIAAKDLGRKYLGMEINDEYYQLALSRVKDLKSNNTQLTLLWFWIIKAYYNYLAEEVLTPFYENRLKSLNALCLSNILKRKNPYLFKAKNLELAGDFVKSIVDAFLSSQEETIFGNLLKGFAIYVSHQLHNGFKSNFRSIDLEFECDNFNTL